MLIFETFMLTYMESLFLCEVNINIYVSLIAV